MPYTKSSKRNLFNRLGKNWPKPEGFITYSIKDSLEIFKNSRLFFRPTDSIDHDDRIKFKPETQRTSQTDVTYSKNKQLILKLSGMHYKEILKHNLALISLTSNLVFYGTES